MSLLYRFQGFPRQTAKKLLRRLIRKLKGSPPPPLRRLASEAGVAGKGQRIPSHVYQTIEIPWVHQDFAESHLEFRSRNPSLKFHLFDSNERAAYMYANWGSHPIYEIFQKAVFAQMRADIFRYCIIFDRGGYYFDVNKGCKVPLNSLHSQNDSGFISFESHQFYLFPTPVTARALRSPMNYVIQFAFGFEAGHPVLKRAIESIVALAPFFDEKHFPDPKGAIMALTGPGLFTRAIHEYFSQASLGGIAQVSVDLDNQLEFRLKGSRKLINPRLHYAKLRNFPILTADDYWREQAREVNQPTIRALRDHNIEDNWT